MPVSIISVRRCVRPFITSSYPCSAARERHPPFVIHRVLPRFPKVLLKNTLFPSSPSESPSPSRPPSDSPPPDEDAHPEPLDIISITDSSSSSSSPSPPPRAPRRSTRNKSKATQGQYGRGGRRTISIQTPSRSNAPSSHDELGQRQQPISIDTCLAPKKRKASSNDAFQSTKETTAPDSEARRRGCP